jgi:hypothetical protein
MAHRDKSQNGRGATTYYDKAYIPGVGTKFPEIGETESTGVIPMLGKGGALGGAARIYWGLIQAINVMHRYVMKQVPIIPDDEAGKLCQGEHLESFGMEDLKKYVNKLANVLRDNKPSVTMLTISVFGFSRGAAQARAFCNSFYKLCKPQGNDYTLAGVPVRIIFLGLFDTVATVGVAGADLLNSDGHQSWATGNLRVHPAIKKCVHFVAAHEVRACFPVDSVRYRGKYPANCTETVYPGMHSDVGGGYAPLSQGRSPLPSDITQYDFLAQIPCIHMYKEAYQAGVPLKQFSEMGADETRNFTPTPQAIAAYNAFVAANKASGSTEDVLAQCMHQYRHYRYRKLDTFVKDAIAHGAPHSGSKAAVKKDEGMIDKAESWLNSALSGGEAKEMRDAEYLNLTNEYFRKQCHNFQRKYANDVLLAKRDETDRQNAALVNPTGVKPHTKPSPTLREHLQHDFIKQDLDLWEAMHRVGETPAAVVDFFDKYLHDSIAGFAQDSVDEYALNGRGYMRLRGVYDNGGE